MIIDKLVTRRASPDAGDEPPHALNRQRRPLVNLKVLYFFYFAGQGTFFTFINVYYASIGLGGTQIGLINTVAPLVGMISAPVWGLLSDRYGRTRRILMIAVGGVIALILALSAVSSFALLLPVVGLYALFNSTILPLLDSTTLSVLGAHRERYGVQRVWGTIGFILTSLLTGYVLELTGLRGIFPGYAIAMGCFLVALIGLPQRPVKLGGALVSGVGAMVRQPPWWLFAGSLLLLGLATSGMANFLSVMVRQMGGSDGLIGLIWTVAAVAELPVMASSGPLLKRFGASRLMAVALVAYAVRMALYGLMPVPEWALGIHLLGGLSFGLYWLAAVTYANELAPPDLKATSQGLLLAVTSLASMIGATFTGWLFDQVGPAVMFRILAGCCVLALALFGVGRMLIKRYHAPSPSGRASAKPGL